MGDQKGHFWNLGGAPVLNALPPGSTIDARASNTHELPASTVYGLVLPVNYPAVSNYPQLVGIRAEKWQL